MIKPEDMTSLATIFFKKCGSKVFRQSLKKLRDSIQFADNQDYCIYTNEYGDSPSTINALVIVAKDLKQHAVFDALMDKLQKTKKFESIHENEYYNKMAHIERYKNFITVIPLHGMNIKFLKDNLLPKLDSKTAIYRSIKFYISRVEKKINELKKFERVKPVLKSADFELSPFKETRIENDADKNKFMKNINLLKIKVSDSNKTLIKEFLSSKGATVIDFPKTNQIAFNFNTENEVGSDFFNSAGMALETILGKAHPIIPKLLTRSRTISAALKKYDDFKQKKSTMMYRTLYKNHKSIPLTYLSVSDELKEYQTNPHVGGSIPYFSCYVGGLFVGTRLLKQCEQDLKKLWAEQADTLLKFSMSIGDLLSGGKVGINRNRYRMQEERDDDTELFVSPEYGIIHVPYKDTPLAEYNKDFDYKAYTKADVVMMLPINNYALLVALEYLAAEVKLLEKTSGEMDASDNIKKTCSTLKLLLRDHPLVIPKRFHELLEEPIIIPKLGKALIDKIKSDYNKFHKKEEALAKELPKPDIIRIDFG